MVIVHKPNLNIKGINSGLGFEHLRNKLRKVIAIKAQCEGGKYFKNHGLYS